MPINFSNSDYSTNIYKGTGNVSISVNGQLNNQMAAANLSSLKFGETISGEVIAQDGKNVTLKLSDGQTINARLDGNSNVMLGKLLSFEVNTSSDNNTILLRPLFSNLNGSSTVNAALKAASLALSDNNITMTQSMIDAGMSINKNALTDMARVVNAYPNADPASIVMMTKMGLPIDEITVTQYENYKNFEHQIINEVNTLGNEIADSIAEIAAGNSEEGMAVVKDLLSVIDSSLVENLSNDEVHVSTLENLAGRDSFTDTENDTALTNNVILSDNDEIAINMGNKAGSDISLSNNQNNVEENDGLRQSVADITEKANNTETNAPLLKQETLSKINDLQELTKQYIPENPSKSDVIDFIKLTAEYLNNNQIEDGEKNILRDKFSELFKDGDIRKILSDAVRDQLTLSPEKVGKEGQVDELYNRILKISQKLIETTSQHNNTNNGLNSIAESAQNLQNNVYFMNEINQFVNYVQLPLKMYQENAHGELYVYSNKKKLQDNDGNLTALLHLDMEHLGPMDVYVSMKEFTNVTTNFRLSSEELLDFIADNIHLLDERLVAKGYNTSTNVTLSDKLIGSGASITDEFLKDNPEESTKSITCVQFDVRA